MGIGANTAIFSVVSGVLLKPLPYPDPESLVSVWQTAPGLGIKELNASPATYFTYREESHTFQDVGLWQNDAVSVTGGATNADQPEQVPALRMTDGTLPLLGIQPALGRLFSSKDDEPGAARTVILSYGYWQRKFGGDATVIGRGMILNAKPCQVIGVLPQSFRFFSFKPELIRPMQLNRNEVFVGNFSYQALARLKPGVTLAQANADVARMLPIMMDKFRPAPGMNNEMLKEARLGPSVRPLKQDVVGDVGKVLWVVMGTLGMVLFIACANVANLLLVRAEGRQQELAIRAALGAGWGRIARELLIESVTLGLTGGLLGVGLAYVAVRALVALAPAGLPRLNEISLDAPVLLFTMAISLAAGVLFGLIPVFKYAGPQLGSALREGGRSISDGRERHRARSVLVVVQVALALVLLISSGLMLRTFQALRAGASRIHQSGRGAHSARVDTGGAGARGRPRGADVRRDGAENFRAARRLLGGAGQFDHHGWPERQRPDLRRRPNLLRLADSRFAAVQIYFARLLQNDGQPSVDRPRSGLDRHP